MKNTDKKEFANGEATILDRNSFYEGTNKENGFL